MIHCNLGLILVATGTLFVFFYLLGQAILMKYMKNYRHYFAPVVGYAVYAYALYVLMHATTSAWVIGTFTVLLFGASLYVCVKYKNYPPKTYAVALGAAGIIALYVLYIMWVKTTPDGHTVLMAPSYDHIKTAITSSIVNSGLPVVNPFCALPSRLTYYFLYYVPSAAQAILLGMNSYEAEISSALLAVLVGLLTMLGTLSVVRQKECDTKSILLLMLLSTTGCMYVYLPFLSAAHGFDSIVTTLLWTPQTLVAVSCLLVVIVLVHCYRMTPVLLLSLLLAVILGLSAYIAIVAVAGLGLYFIVDICTSPCRKKTFGQWAGVGLVSLGFALGFIINQVGSVSGQFPIAFHIYPWTLWQNPLWAVAGFWTIYCLIQMPTLVVLNAWKLRLCVFKKYPLFYLMIFASLLITCFLETTISANDLGWRAILVAIVLLTVLATHWFFDIKGKVLRICVLVLAVVCVSSPFNKLNHHPLHPPYIVRPLSAQSMAAIRQYITVQDAFMNNIWKERNAKFRNANIDVMIGLQRNSCYASAGAVAAYCDKELRAHLMLSKYLFSRREIPSYVVPSARAIGCTKFLFFRTDHNFNNEGALEKAGLHKIYQNDEIKIYE